MRTLKNEEEKLEGKDIKSLQRNTFSVSIGDWTNPRKVHWNGEQIILEVVPKNCFCRTCVKRFAFILFSMRDRNIDYELYSDFCIKFIPNKLEKESDMELFLTKSLGLEVKIKPS